MPDTTREPAVSDRHGIPTGRLEGLSVLITGGASGLGRAIVSRFLREGALVTVLDRSSNGFEQIRAEHGEALQTVVGNVTSGPDNLRAVTTATDAFGGVDVFVGNAGIWDFGRPLLEMSLPTLEDSYRELFDVNVKGYLLGAKAVAQSLVERRGSMIFTLSNAAFFPRGGGPLYTASKHAGVGLVRQLAYELAPHVRVNAVAPGGMATELRGPQAMGLDNQAIRDILPPTEQLRKLSALELAPRPEDYVDSYLLLAAPSESATVTGSVFDISAVGTPRRAMPEG